MIDRLKRWFTQKNSKNAIQAFLFQTVLVIKKKKMHVQWSQLYITSFKTPLIQKLKLLHPLVQVYVSIKNDDKPLVKWMKIWSACWEEHALLVAVPPSPTSTAPFYWQNNQISQWSSKSWIRSQKPLKKQQQRGEEKTNEKDNFLFWLGWQLVETKNIVRCFRGAARANLSIVKNRAISWLLSARVLADTYETKWGYG